MSRLWARGVRRHRPVRFAATAARSTWAELAATGPATPGSGPRFAPATGPVSSPAG
ncbi:hypothetical protein NWT09_31410 [Mycolicibacterium sp. jd]|uniref:hypothetical protein n=1 Tax=unclassified Mycolicibacterium TaxID=2636767 RepID=UPI00351B19D7